MPSLTRVRPDATDTTDAHAALGAYATDALTADEAAAMADHLAGCTWCRLELEEFGETTAELAHLYAVPAPDSVRAAVLGAIGRVRPLPPLPPSSTDDTRSAATTRRPARRSGRARVPARMLIGLAAAAVAVVGIGGVTVQHQVQQQADDQARVVAAQRAATTRQESTILSAPDATIATRRLADGSSITFLVSRSRNAAMVISADLQDPGLGKVYQAWTGQGPAGRTTYQPDRTFGGGTDQRVVLGGDIGTATGLAITVEPTGGSASPTSAPLAQVTL